MLKTCTTLVEMVFGSHLYGLDSPNSDNDFKGVFVPSMRDMLLGRVSKTLNFNTKQNSTEKNSASDVDRELYSIQYFFDLARKGETVALDMLHAPPRTWVTNESEWHIIHCNRHLFHTKTLSSFVGYAKTQAAKYGIKGSRLSDAKKVLECLRSFPKKKVHDVLYILPVGEHCGPSEDSKFYEVCGKKMVLTATTDHYVEMLENFVREFGERAKQAESNQGVDWKAISHAFRAGFQVRALLIEGDFTFPLKETEFLKQVKSGSLPFKTASPMLEELMHEVEGLSRHSYLPEKVDNEAIDWLLLEVMSRVTERMK